MWSLAKRWWGHRRLRNDGPRIFIIGPSKCATTSLHEFFVKNGISSLHCRDGRSYIALEIERRLHDKAALKRYLDTSTVFSDMVHARSQKRYNSSRYFKLFDELYPDAYFIFNDRSIERLLASSKSHKGGTSLHLRQMLTGQTEDEIMAMYREEYFSHKTAVFDYFRDNPRFLHFHIERDGIDVIVRHLSADYILSTAYWEKHNVSAPVPKTAAMLSRRRHTLAFRWHTRLASIILMLLGVQFPLQAMLITDALDVIPGF